MPKKTVIKEEQYVQGDNIWEVTFDLPGDEHTKQGIINTIVDLFPDARNIKIIDAEIIKVPEHLERRRYTGSYTVCKSKHTQLL